MVHIQEKLLKFGLRDLIGSLSAYIFKCQEVSSDHDGSAKFLKTHCLEDQIEGCMVVSKAVVLVIIYNIKMYCQFTPGT